MNHDVSWLETLRWRWRMRRTPRTPIARLAPDTRAKIVGVATPLEEPLLTPFTGRACVCYRVRGYRIERRDHVPTLIDDVEEGQRFYVEDDSGIARIDRKGFCAWLTPMIEIAHAEQYGAAANLERFVARYGWPRASFFDAFSPRFNLGGNSFRYVEQAVPVGAPVAVLGAVHRTGEPEPGRGGMYREQRTLWQLEPPSEARLAIAAVGAGRATVTR